MLGDIEMNWYFVTYCLILLTQLDHTTLKSQSILNKLTFFATLSSFGKAKISGKNYRQCYSLLRFLQIVSQCERPNK